MSNTCTWCGNHVRKPLRDSFWSTKNFCGQRCLTEWQNQNGRTAEARANNEVLGVQREILEIERNRLQDQEDQRRSEESKRKNQEIAIQTLKVYKVVKPYLLYIVLAYVAGFIATYLSVHGNKDRQVTIIFFCIPLPFVLWLIYNTIVNKPNND